MRVNLRNQGTSIIRGTKKVLDVHYLQVRSSVSVTLQKKSFFGPPILFLPPKSGLRKPKSRKITEINFFSPKNLCDEGQILMDAEIVTES